jgi:putative nucleotidyltransferase with HDIG domain
LRRIRQFFRASFARVRPDEIAEIEGILTPVQMALFQRMERGDQRHSLDILNTLRQAGQHDTDLLQAALLHDVGKTVPAGGRALDARRPLQRLTVWHRTLVVLLQKGAPGWLERLAADGRGWKRPFAAHVQHAQVSAELAAQVGSTPEVVDLIRKHHDPEPDDKRLALFQRADEQN